MIVVGYLQTLYVVYALYKMFIEKDPRLKHQKMEDEIEMEQQPGKTILKGMKKEQFTGVGGPNEGKKDKQ